MEAIKTNIKEKTQQIIEYTAIIKNLREEIVTLKRELYVHCDHNFLKEVLTSGPYREYEYVCNKCDYTTSHIV
jgi:hypothetical protein